MDCSAFPELETLSKVYSILWDFSHLDEELQNGVLSAKKSPRKQVYLFGQTEPQMVPEGEHTTVVPVPVIMAVETDVPLPSKLGLNSVQMQEESVVDMTRYKMDWAPLAVPEPVDENDPKPGSKKRRKTTLHASRFWCLDCKQRSGMGTLVNMKEDRTRMFDYCMPYVLLPHKQEEEITDTSVDVMCELPGLQAPVVCEFDWEMDDLEEFVQEKMEEEELEGKHKDALTKAVKEAVNSAKKARKEKRDAKKAEIDSIPEDVKQALKNIQIHKFYPMNEKLPKESKSKYINRYYGSADRVV